MQTFNDRWTYANPTLAALNPATLTDQQLSAASPDFVRYATQVRGHSILTKQKTLVEIYRIATLESDPRIALYLAAAKDPSGRRLFPDMNAVKAAMFGPATNTDTSFLDSERNIFVGGIWRVSAALTAARLIGQLAQIDEQAKHAIWLEKQALKDLEELLRLVDTNSLQPEDEQYIQEFVFEERDLELVTPLRARVFMPSLSQASWSTVAVYTGTVTTAQLCADIANAINERCLAAADTNVLAAPILAGGKGIHRIELTARRRDAVVSADLITVAFDYGGNRLPFVWGVHSDEMTTNVINSAIIVVKSGRVSTLTSDDNTVFEPIVLYFRRVQSDDSSQDNVALPDAHLTFRVSPTMTQAKTITIPYIVNEDRPSQVATALLNELHGLKGDIKALGALFRNDPQMPSALTAMELVAWTVTKTEAWIILDILEMPSDIELATGNLRGPFTAFSTKPRSVRVPARVIADATKAIGSQNALPRIIKPPASRVSQQIRDKLKTMNPFWR